MEGVNALLNLASVATSVMSDITKEASPTPPVTTTVTNKTSTTTNKPMVTTRSMRTRSSLVVEK